MTKHYKEKTNKTLSIPLSRPQVFQDARAIRTCELCSVVKNPPAMWETRVRSLGWEDPLEKGIATPLQYSCLEDSHDRGAWRAPVHGVAKNRTRPSDGAQHTRTFNVWQVPCSFLFEQRWFSLMAHLSPTFPLLWSWFFAVVTTLQCRTLPAMQETLAQSLGQEDPLEEERAPHSSVLVWEIPWTEKPGGLQSRGSQESNMA